MKWFRALMSVCATGCLAACATVQPLTPVDPGKLAANTLSKTILVAVENDNSVAIKTESDLGCGVGKQKGCFYVPRNKLAEITYRFEGRPNWHFRRIQVCPGGILRKDCGTVDLIERLEFVAGSDRKAGFVVADESGVIELSRIGTKPRKFVLFNQNNFDQRYYYRLQACPDDATDTSFDSRECGWNEDPPIDNDGRLQ